MTTDLPPTPLPVPSGRWRLECPRCGALLDGDSEDDALDAWDDHRATRHPAGRPPGDLRHLRLLHALVDPADAHFGWAVEAVREYYQDYRGAYFDRFRALENGLHENEFTSDDLVAVSMLNVEVPGKAALEILHGRADQLNATLALVPTIPLHEQPVEAIRPGSPADDLFAMIRRRTSATASTGIPGMGVTKTSKLLARKRLAFLPVIDARVRQRLEPGRSYWEFVHAWLTSGPRPVAGLEQIRTEAGVEGVSLLRVLDVAVWRYDVDQ